MNALLISMSFMAGVMTYNLVLSFIVGSVLGMMFSTLAVVVFAYGVILNLNARCKVQK